MNVLHLSRRKSSGVYKVESAKIVAKSREDSKETRIKKYEPIRNSVKKMTNLKDYQNKGTSSSKKLRETKSYTFSNYIKTDIISKPELVQNQGSTPTDHKVQLRNEVEDDEDDIMVFSERPNEQIPVPHQMTTINQKMFAQQNIEGKKISDKVS